MNQQEAIVFLKDWRNKLESEVKKQSKEPVSIYDLMLLISLIIAIAEEK